MASSSSSNLLDKKKESKDKKVAALFDAIRSGNLAEVKKLLKKVPIDVSNTSKQTPLHTAAVEGQLTILIYLIEQKKAPINAKDRDGWTPLHCACHSGHLDICDHLIALGALISCTTSLLLHSPPSLLITTA